MKKILTAFYATDNPWHVINFATSYAKEHSSVINAVFLSTNQEGINADYPFPNDLSITQEQNTLESIIENNNKLIDQNIKLFKEECELAGISFKADKNISIQELIDNTDDVDLIAIDSHSDFLNKILPHIHCPAFLASAYELPQKVILMYNNSPSSKSSIEMYISLLPQFKSLPTYLLSINPEKADENEMKIYSKEKLQSHFSDLTLKLLYGNKEHEMDVFFSEIPGRLLAVMGAFGRSALSRFFHQSFANTVLDKSGVSLFISHK